MFNEKVRNKLIELRDKKLKARKHLKNYMPIIKEDYKPAWFHNVMCDELTQFAFSEEKENRMIFVPPQNGKSLHSTIGLPTFLLGLNPKLKIAVVSYNNDVASLFGDDISRILKSPGYRSVFPNTKVGLNGLKDNKYITETSEGGYIISVGVNGTLTSRTVDIFIFDDLYKGPSDAWSVAFREKVWNFYNTVAETRGHKKSKQLILYTRWHDEDLAGKLLESNAKDKWKVTTFQGIKTDEFNHPEDKRSNGQMLWPERHDISMYEELKDRDPVAYEALVQQNPKPVTGLMYPTHMTYKIEDLPKYGINKFYCDTADAGTDSLVCIFYKEYKEFCYITDIYMTKDNMDTTYRELARRIRQNESVEGIIESNNGGRFFGSQVEKELIENYKYGTRIIPFTQTKNKQTRIYTNSASVKNNVYFPAGWENNYPNAYREFTKYRVDAENEHDDFADAITGVVENNFNIISFVQKITVNR